MAEIPESLLRRSAEAKAKALGLPVEQVLAEMKGEKPPDQPPVAEEPIAATEETPDRPPTDAQPAEQPVSVPEETPDARRQTPAENPEPATDAESPGAGVATPEEAPTDAPLAEAPGSVPEETPDAGRQTPEDPVVEGQAPTAGEPGSVPEETPDARRQTPEGSDVDARIVEEPAIEVPNDPEAVQETVTSPKPAPEPDPSAEPEKELVSVGAGTGEAAAAPAPPAASAAAAPVAPEAPPSSDAPPVGDGPPSNGSGNGSGNGKRASLVQPRPVAPAAGLPEGVRTQRLLTVVKARAIQQVKTEPTDKVNTWPHLVIGEFAALLAVTGVLIILSVILQAPLLDPANFNATPNPSKAPWYFLGLQELLSYFDPQIAGVTVPTIVGLVGFMAVPYVDRNPSTKPADRKFAVMLYTIFMAGAATLTIFGVLFRGRGFNFSYPWKDGVFFDDLKDWVNFE